MSSNVSEQIKVPGLTAKSVEDHNIPWSQQVDEASYENLSSPTTEENTCPQQSSMQFQFPPFNAKDSKSNSWNSQKPRNPINFVRICVQIDRQIDVSRDGHSYIDSAHPPDHFSILFDGTISFSSHTYKHLIFMKGMKIKKDLTKKHGKQSAFSNSKRDEFQSNTWGPQKKGKPLIDNPSNNNNRSTRMENIYVPGKTESKAIMNVLSDEKKMITTSQSAPPKKTTWASIASQPAKLASRTNFSTLNHKKKGPGMPPPPMVPGKHNLDVNAWESPNNNPPPVPSLPSSTDKSSTEIHSNYSVGRGNEYDVELQIDRSQKKNQHSREENNSNNNNYGRPRASPVDNLRKNWSLPPHNHSRDLGDSYSGHIRRSENNIVNSEYQSRKNMYTHTESADLISHVIREPSLEQTSKVENLATEASSAVLEKLHDKNNYNPLEIDLNIATSARFFVIKSYSEDDIHRSIKYEIWCSTDHGNKRLDDAFKERQKEGGQILLFFSVNGSGHFCGMAQMMTAVDYNSTSSVWSQDKWKGKFKVKWIYVKDVPNTKLRHIRLENNDNKSVTNSRDTQEVPNSKGIEVLQILHCYKHSTSIFDDFYHYEKKQEEEVSRKPSTYDNLTMTSPVSRNYNRQIDDRERDRDTRGIGGSQKYFTGGSSSFHERKNSYRESFRNSFNDHRRNESHKLSSVSDVTQCPRNGRIDVEVRENNDLVSRHKFDYNQRPKQNREHDFCEKELRFRTPAKDVLRDNGNDY